MMAECPICGKKTAIYWPQFYVYRRGKKFFCGADCTEVYDMQRFRARTGWKPRKAVKPISKMSTKMPQKDKTQQTTQERKKEPMKRNKLTLEQKKKAMEIYQAGGDATGYLKECGQKNPSAALVYLKKTMEKKTGKATVETAVALPAEARPKKPVPVNGGEWETPETPEEPKEPTLADAMQGMKDAADRFFGQYCPEEKKEEQPEPEKHAPFKYRTTGIQTEVGEFWVVREGKIKWVPGRLAKEDPVMQVMWPEAEPALVPEMWRRFAEIIMDVLDLLEVES